MTRRPAWYRLTKEQGLTKAQAELIHQMVMRLGNRDPNRCRYTFRGGTKRIAANLARKGYLKDPEDWLTPDSEELILTTHAVRTVRDLYHDDYNPSAIDDVKKAIFDNIEKLKHRTKQTREKL